MTGTQQPAAPIAVVDYPVLFDTPKAQAKLTAVKRNRTSRIVSLCFSIAISVGLFLYFREMLGDLAWPLLTVSLVLPVAFLGWAIVKELVVRSEVAPTVSGGLAVGIARGGLLLTQGWLPWSEVGAIRAVSRRLGRGPDLLIEPRMGLGVRLPLEYLSATPAALDGAVRALSAGRARVDFAGLDA